MSERRALLIINSGAGTADGPIEAAADTLSGRGFDVTFRRPKDPTDITRLIEEEGPAHDRIILGGGDGTFSHSAGALMRAGKPVGFLPMGTANDLARTLDLPESLEEAAWVAGGNHTRRIDLGEVNGRPFFNVASIGFSVHVARHQTEERKKSLGILSYPLSWLDAQRHFTPFHVTLRHGRRKRRFRATMVAVGNGVYFGGGLMIADDAAIDDGWLNTFYVRPVSLLGMARLLPLLRFGAIRRRQDIRMLRTSELHLEADPIQQINVDGEIVERTPARFSILRKALEVHVPAPRLD